MEFNVVLEPQDRDTGGGTREVKAEICIDNRMEPREMRRVVMYEVLGCMLDGIVGHDKLDDLSLGLQDVLDQLDKLINHDVVSFTGMDTNYHPFQGWVTHVTVDGRVAELASPVPYKERDDS